VLLGRKLDGCTFFGHVDDATTQTRAVAEDVGDFVYIDALLLSTFFNVHTISQVRSRKGTRDSRGLIRDHPSPDRAMLAAMS